MSSSTRASGREPVTAEDCGRDCGASSRTGREHLQGSSPPESTTSLLASSCSSSPDGIGRHVVTESGPRPSTWPAAWPWSSRRGRSGDNRPLYALNWTRLSCHRFVANRVRLSLFILAYNLGNFLRRLCLPKAVRHWSLRSVQVKLIKMGGRVVRHSRRLIFQLSEVSVPRRLFQGVLDRIGRLSPAPS